MNETARLLEETEEREKAQDEAVSSMDGSVDDRVKIKLLLVWLQNRDIHLMKYKLGEKAELCMNATKLIDQFCAEL